MYFYRKRVSTSSSSEEEKETYHNNYNTSKNDALPSRRSNMAERSKYIPLRLTHKERKLLHLLEASLNVSQYTDRVDVIQGDNQSPMKNLKTKILDISAILTGLLIAADYKHGQTLLGHKDFAEYSTFFQDIFEIGRRHKIMNPEKMRTEYGKMIYLLQDMTAPTLVDQLGFAVNEHIKTVYDFLEKRNCAKILEDNDIYVATQEILQDGSKSRSDVQREIKRKEKVVKSLCAKYRNERISEDEIKFCLYSLTDNNSFLNSNAEPIIKMLKYLTTFFNQHRSEEKYALEITAGEKGARLTHTHEQQYLYVYQSLKLWQEIMENMFMLWFFAEEDLLNAEIQPEYKNTGQGFHRVQAAPRVLRAMHAILAKVQSTMEWVGSSTVHLGDHNVPNALMFIDKYTQVPRILVPIVSTLESIDKLYRQATTKHYIDKAFGGDHNLKKMILTDFFKFGFDGSGADNFIDAGSCIDGRLTSAWNWCSHLETKSFYPIFLLSGFTSFDGDFQK
jgi:hypothetical protein